MGDMLQVWAPSMVTWTSAQGETVYVGQLCAPYSQQPVGGSRFILQLSAATSLMLCVLISRGMRFHPCVLTRGLTLQVVDVKKLQGTWMSVSTERGALKVKAIYAESSCVSSCSGRVELGHVHG